MLACAKFRTGRRKNSRTHSRGSRRSLKSWVKALQLTRAKTGTFWGLPLGELKVTTLLNDVFSIMRQHQMHLPSNLALLLKTVIMIEGLGVNLDPDFQLTRSLTPYTERLVRRQYSPFRWFRSLRRASLEFTKLGVELPQQLRRIVSAAEDGNLEIGMRPEGFGPVIDRLERIANRIVLGVIAAAFINGLAVLASVYRPPG